MLMFGLGLAFLILFFVQRASGPIGSNPAPDWIYIVMSLSCLALSGVVINFRALSINITPDGVTASYGRFRRHIPMHRIAGIAQDEGSGLRNYWGWGIRISRREGKRVTVYNVAGHPLVLLKLKGGKGEYFGFSTRQPARVIEIIKSRITA